MAAIIGFNSHFSDSSVVLPQCTLEMKLRTFHGHIAYQQDDGRIFGFLPDPLPDIVDTHTVYTGRYYDQTHLFASLKNKIRVDRYEFSTTWHEEAYSYIRLQGNECSRYCMYSPIHGPPYNCISFIREVVGLGDLPNTNYIGLLFDELKLRKGFIVGEK